MYQPSSAAQDFTWLLNRFVNDTASVLHAIAVSVDGILLAASNGLERTQAEHFAAISSSLNSLSKGAAHTFDLDQVEQIMVEMTNGFLFATTISAGSALGVIAEKNCDIGMVAYEMTLMVQRAGAALTPALIDELKNALTV